MEGSAGAGVEGSDAPESLGACSVPLASGVLVVPLSGVVASGVVVSVVVELPGVEVSGAVAVPSAGVVASGVTAVLGPTRRMRVIGT